MPCLLEKGSYKEVVLLIRALTSISHIYPHSHHKREIHTYRRENPFPFFLFQPSILKVPTVNLKKELKTTKKKLWITSYKEDNTDGQMLTLGPHCYIFALFSPFSSFNVIFFVELHDVSLLYEVDGIELGV